MWTQHRIPIHGVDSDTIGSYQHSDFGRIMLQHIARYGPRREKTKKEPSIIEKLQQRAVSAAHAQLDQKDAEFKQLAEKVQEEYVDKPYAFHLVKPNPEGKVPELLVKAEGLRKAQNDVVAGLRSDIGNKETIYVDALRQKAQNIIRKAHQHDPMIKELKEFVDVTHSKNPAHYLINTHPRRDLKKLIGNLFKYEMTVNSPGYKNKVFKPPSPPHTPQGRSPAKSPTKKTTIYLSRIPNVNKKLTSPTRSAKK